MVKTLLIAGGVFNVLVAVFHLFFWKIFKWPGDLMSISLNNRAIIQTFNLVTIVILVFFAAISFFFIEELRTSSIGALVTLTIAAFWLIRAVAQIVYWGEVWDTKALIIFLVCMLMAVIYIIPVLPVTYY